MTTYLLICLFALAAGLVHGLAGFGNGIVLMIALPYLFPVVQASSVTQAICLIMMLSMVVRYRAHARFDLAVKPAALFIACSCVSLLFAKSVDQQVMKLVLGVFLALLGAYFLFFQKEGKPVLSLPARLFCIAFSGACDGLFGIGGPLMVVYFLSMTDSTEEYLGTAQVFFSLCVCFTLAFRISQGVLDPSLAPAIVAGGLLAIGGVHAAGRAVSKLDPATIRTFTYVVIGLAGLYNAAASLVGLLAA